MSELAEAVVAAGGSSRGSDFSVLARRFYRHVTADDLGAADSAELDPDLLVADLEALLAVAMDRPAQRANVSVHSEPDAPIAVAAIVTDDMPFLVDSVTSALALEERTVRLVIHPQLVVRRDAAGRLLEVLDLEVDDPRPADALAESWMRIEIERDFVREDDRRTTDHLRRVLRDVRAAVADWELMRALALGLAEDLLAQPPQEVPATDVEDAVDLLRWMADERFVFLGYRQYELQEVDGEDALVAVADTGLGILGEQPEQADPDRSHSQSFSGCRLRSAPRLAIHSC